MSINRTALLAKVNDDGSNTVGSLVDRAFFETTILDPIDVELAAAINTQGPPITQTITLTGNQTPTLTPGCRHLRCNNASLLTLGGFDHVGVVPGQILTIEAIGAGRVDLPHKSIGTDTQLDNLCTSAPMSLAPGTGRAFYVYISPYWRMISHDQGAALAWTPADGSGGGLMLTVVTANYLLKGRLVYVDSQVVYPATANGANAKISGLPFTAAGRCALANTNATVDIRLGITAAAVIDLMSNVGVAKTNAQMTGQNFYLSGTYFTT